VAFTEPFWLAIWGLTLMMIASTVPARRRKQEERAEQITVFVVGLTD